jgi:hypothetical protein
MPKKELTLKEHLRRIQRKGGKARWEGVSEEERTEQARKAVSARWAKAKKAVKKTAAKKSAAKGPESKNSV